MPRVWSSSCVCLSVAALRAPLPRLTVESNAHRAKLATPNRPEVWRCLQTIVWASLWSPAIDWRPVKNVTWHVFNKKGDRKKKKATSQQPRDGSFSPHCALPPPGGEWAYRSTTWNVQKLQICNGAIAKQWRDVHSHTLHKGFTYIHTYTHTNIAAVIICKYNGPHSRGSSTTPYMSHLTQPLQVAAIICYVNYISFNHLYSLFSVIHTGNDISFCVEPYRVTAPSIFILS